jgi:hypothetical protein
VGGLFHFEAQSLVSRLGTKLPTRNVRSSAAIGAKPDMGQANLVENDPSQTYTAREEGTCQPDSVGHRIRGHCMD